MSGHDPMCELHGVRGAALIDHLDDPGCDCALIARVRADERENPRRRTLALEMERRAVAEEIAAAIEDDCPRYDSFGVRTPCSHCASNAAIARSVAAS